MAEEMPESHPASVLGKAYLLLGAFAGGPATLGLTELSRRSGVPKASTHRLAVELVDLGLLARNAKRRRSCSGPERRARSNSRSRLLSWGATS